MNCFGDGVGHHVADEAGDSGVTGGQIVELIHGDESPVGIDAKKTHMLNFFTNSMKLKNGWMIWKSLPSRQIIPSEIWNTLSPQVQKLYRNHQPA